MIDQIYQQITWGLRVDWTTTLSIPASLRMECRIWRKGFRRAADRFGIDTAVASCFYTLVGDTDYRSDYDVGQTEGGEERKELLTVDLTIKFR